MTEALILAAPFLPLVGFIAGALWERRKHERLSQARTIETADLQLLANNLGAENLALREHIDSQVLARRLMQRAADPWRVS